METGLITYADSIAGVLNVCEKISVNNLLFNSANYFSVKVLTYLAPS